LSYKPLFAFFELVLFFLSRKIYKSITMHRMPFRRCISL